MSDYDERLAAARRTFEKYRPTINKLKATPTEEADADVAAELIPLDAASAEPPAVDVSFGAPAPTTPSADSMERLENERDAVNNNPTDPAGSATDLSAAHSLSELSSSLRKIIRHYDDDDGGRCDSPTSLDKRMTGRDSESTPIDDGLELTRWRLQAEKLQVQHLRLQSELAELQRENRHLKERLNDETSTLKSANDKQLVEAMSRVDEREAEVVTLRAEAATALTRLAQLQVENDSMRADLANGESIIDSLKEEVRNVSEKERCAQEELELHRSRTASTNDSIEVLREQLFVLNTENTHLRSQLDEHIVGKGNAVSLQEQIATKEQELVRLQVRLREAESASVQLQQQVVVEQERADSFNRVCIEKEQSSRHEIDLLVSERDAARHEANVSAAKLVDMQLELERSLQNRQVSEDLIEFERNERAIIETELRHAKQLLEGCDVNAARGISRSSSSAIELALGAPIESAESLGSVSVVGQLQEEIERIEEQLVVAEDKVKSNEIELAAIIDERKNHSTAEAVSATRNSDTINERDPRSERASDNRSIGTDESFQLLQQRFVQVCNENADLKLRFDEANERMELLHGEAETITDYINMYQQQKQKLSERQQLVERYESIWLERVDTWLKHRNILLARLAELRSLSTEFGDQAGAHGIVPKSAENGSRADSERPPEVEMEFADGFSAAPAGSADWPTEVGDGRTLADDWRGRQKLQLRLIQEIEHIEHEDREALLNYRSTELKAKKTAPSHNGDLPVHTYATPTIRHQRRRSYSASDSAWRDARPMSQDASRVGRGSPNDFPDNWRAALIQRPDSTPISVADLCSIRNAVVAYDGPIKCL